MGGYHDLAVDLVVVINKEDKTAPWIMYYKDGMETTLYEIDVLRLDAKQMYDAGQHAVNEILESVTQSVNRGYPNYDRIAAREYVLEYSLNPTQCYDDGTTCGVLQDRTKWNNSVYPYHTLFKHNDCANFVSQAMSTGGLPEGGTWFRIKYVTTQSWGAAWTSVSSMKAFMTDSNRRYWDTSTFAAANAGNILLTSSSHVVMITLNDTVVHRFTAHTNDRRNYVFNNNSAYQYYTIKAT
ncbi:MAG TPA: amidase domain-containing protein [Thermoclostridium sp.]|nr:amidase domain-containing protein [Thermoclostridium sp.]